MRTSNKILLGVFLAILLITIAVQAALYVKYKNGDFIIEGRNSPNSTKKSLAGIHSIYLGGCDNVEIRYADSSYVEIENDPKFLNIQTTGNTLKINCSVRNYTYIVIYIKDTADIVAASSQITLRGSTDSTEALTYKLHLMDEVNLMVAYQSVSPETRYYFKSLDVTAKSSGIVMNEGANIQALNLSLTETNAVDLGATIGEINVKADSKSTVSLRGTNLRKLKLP